MCQYGTVGACRSGGLGCQRDDEVGAEGGREALKNADGGRGVPGWRVWTGRVTSVRLRWLRIGRCPCGRARRSTRTVQTSQPGLARRGRMSVYRVTDVIGTSTQSWEEAAAVAVNTARQTIRDLRVAEVVAQDIHLTEDGGL